LQPIFKTYLSSKFCKLWVMNNLRFFVLFSIIVCIVGTSKAQNAYGEYRIWVEVEGDGAAHITQIWFDDESTWGDPNFPPTYSWDACCDSEMLFGNSNNPHVYTEVLAAPVPPNNHRLSTNGLPLLFEYTPIPMGFYVGNNLAQYTFTFSQLYTLPSNVTVELEDLSLNVSQDLLSDSVYTTWGASNDDEGRFIIHINPLVTDVEAYLNTEDQIRVSISDNEINLDSDQRGIVSVRLVNSKGQLVFAKNLQPTEMFKIPIQHLPIGVYLITAITDTGQARHFKVVL